MDSCSGGITAAYCAFDLLSKSLVQQSIYKRVNSRIEHDHRVRNGVHGGTEAVGFKMTDDVDY